MQTWWYRPWTACLSVAVAALMLSGPAVAARVAVMSNNLFNETAANFNVKIPRHTFTGVDVSTSVPSLASLTANYDVILVFEDLTFPNATAVGNRVAQFAQTGRPVVLGTFYEQDRSDGSTLYNPHGWGALETIDPNTTDGTGTPYADRTLDVASIIPHPLTQGVLSLGSKRFGGGNQAKAGSIIVAAWAQPNAKGAVDPAISYRLTDAACVIHVAIAPHYPEVAMSTSDFSGDFYVVWENAFNFSENGCIASSTDGAVAIPAMSDVAMAATALLIVAIGAFGYRQRSR
jgi:hypothetical protein